MAVEGIDYAAAGANPEAVKLSGAKFVCRYLSTPGNAKNLTRAEAAQLRKAGVAIVLVFELDATRALGGYQRGRADAGSARKQAAACGAPAKQPIYFAVDFDAQPADLAKVVSYVRGAASVLGAATTGVYGGHAAVKACLDAKVCRYAWQTYAWSGGKWDPRAELRQYLNDVPVAGITADRDRAVARDGNYGQWKPPAASKPKPLPKPAPVSAPHHTPATAPNAVTTVTLAGPKGGVIGHRCLAKALGLLPGLLRRFGAITLTRKKT